MNLSVVDRIRAAVHEVEHHTRTIAPEADPFTGPAERVYDYCRQHTAHLEAEQQNASEALIYKQGLEHAIAAGDTTVVRKHPCPQCGCLGLYWRAESRRAVCVNHYCVDDNGLAHTWELKRLAHEHVAQKSAVARRAT
ncbi:hypothetical protein [Streptomyces sp. NPDC088178]|uniref:hypothetical protein n=1 Tax=Streptomyces sp. NPDC088178 TaxID=3365836 RepID=UPI003806798D